MTDAVRFQPVQPVRAYQRVVEQVEAAVLDGTLKPGDRLASERELMVQFGVSRSTVREALRVLESSGLVRSRPGDPNGAEVLSLTPAFLEKSMTRLLRVDGVSLAELVQFRMLLDGSAGFLAASQRDDDDLAELERTMDAMSDAMALGYEEFSRCDVAFHDAVAAASRNVLVQVCCEAVRGVVVGLIATRIATEADRTALMQRSLRHHSEVLDAIGDGDAARAARLAREHLYAYYADHVGDAERAVLRSLVP